MTLLEHYEEQRLLGESHGIATERTDMVERYARTHSCSIEKACAELGVEVNDYYAKKASIGNQ